MFLSQKVGTPTRRHTPRRPAALPRSQTDTRQTETQEGVGRPPADQCALRMSNAPSTHLFWLNRRHAVHHTPPARRSFRAHHRQAPFLFRGTPPCTRNRLPAKAHSDRFLRRLRRSRRVPVGGCPFPGPLTAAVTPPSAKAARSQRPPRYTYEGKGQRSVPTRHLHRRVPHPVRGADRCGTTASLHRVEKGGPPCSLS